MAWKKGSFGVVKEKQKSCIEYENSIQDRKKCILMNILRLKECFYNEIIMVKNSGTVSHMKKTERE